MTTPHTPGPWKSQPVRWPDPLHVRHITGPDDIVMMKVGHANRRQSHNEAIANAALIAAAPHMKEALIVCQGAVNALLEQVGQMRGLFQDEDETIQDAVDAGEEAQAAARGAMAHYLAGLPEATPRAQQVSGRVSQTADYANMSAGDLDRAFATLMGASPRSAHDDTWSPSQNWSVTGPFLDREGVMFQASLDGGVMAYLRRSGTSGPTGSGPTHLIAALRCILVAHQKEACSQQAQDGASVSTEADPEAHNRRQRCAQ